VTDRPDNLAQTAAVMPFAPIEYEKLTDKVYRVIKERILAQDIEVGARLRDDDLAGQLRVSRTPVREALLRLAREGLVEIIPRSGTHVRIFTGHDIEEIFDLRIALESLAVRTAALALAPGPLGRLRELHKAAEAAAADGEIGPALLFDHEMHRMIIEASGNRKLQEIMGTINDFVTLFRNLGARTPAHRGFTYRHKEIMRALMKRDSEAAARALTEHIEVAKRELFRDFQERKLLSSDGTPTITRPETEGDNGLRRPRGGRGKAHPA
jgi:DNA-binding GntR family transcriptional regulator